jgi:hypothetical protein
MTMQHAAAIALLLTAGLTVSNDAAAANCSTSVRYLRAEARDAKGFKQALSFGVSSNLNSRGLISYTVTYTDKAGATQTKTGNAQYNYDAGQSVETELPDGTKIDEVTITDETVLAVNACTDSAVCRVTDVTIDKASCYAPR